MTEKLLKTKSDFMQNNNTNCNFVSALRLKEKLCWVTTIVEESEELLASILQEENGKNDTMPKE